MKDLELIEFIEKWANSKTKSVTELNFDFSKDEKGVVRVGKFNYVTTLFDTEQNEIERLKSALKLARKHVNNSLIDLDSNGNNFVSVKSVIDEVLEGE